jgi:hypothetical protein
MKKIIISFFFILTVCAASWSLLHPGFFRVHDYVHAARIAEMLRGLQDGQFPVRWSSNFGFGYGMPLFEFYAPLPFYVGAFLYWLGFEVITTIKLLYLICTIFTFLGMYHLGKTLFGRSAGLLSAIALTVAPYRAVNLFVRGSLSEAWGIMALPWVLYGIVSVVRNEKKGWLILLVSLFVLFLSHNITTLIFIPMSVIFGVGYWLIRNRTNLKIQKNVATKKKSVAQTWSKIPTLWRSPLQLILTYILGIGVAAFYLFPAFIEKDFTKVNAIFGGYFHYSHHFLYIRQFFIPNWGYGGSNWGPDDGLSFFLGYGQLLSIAVAGVEVVWAFKKVKLKWSKLSETVLLFPLVLFILLFSLFMTLLKSKPLWDALPFMVAVQFPWRWLSIAITMVALLSGLGASLIRNKMLRFGYVAVLSIAILLSNLWYFQPESYMKNPSDLYYTSSDLIQKQMSDILPDYIPKQMPDKFTPPEKSFIVPAGTEQQVEILINRGHQRLYKTHFLSSNFLNFMIADFPGWKIELDGKEVKKEKGQSGTFGFTVPAGEHYVGVFFADSPIRQYSDTLSLVSLIVFLALIVVPLYEQKNK